MAALFRPPRNFLVPQTETRKSTLHSEISAVQNTAPVLYFLNSSLIPCTSGLEMYHQAVRIKITRIVIHTT
jgi:hypothetical protein